MGPRASEMNEGNAPVPRWRARIEPKFGGYLLATSEDPVKAIDPAGRWLPSKLTLVRMSQKRSVRAAGLGSSSGRNRYHRLLTVRRAPLSPFANDTHDKLNKKIKISAVLPCTCRATVCNHGRQVRHAQLHCTKHQTISERNAGLCSCHFSRCT